MTPGRQSLFGNGVAADHPQSHASFVPALPVPAPPALARTPRRSIRGWSLWPALAAALAGALRRVPWWDLVSQAVLVAGALGVMYPALARGVVQWQDDTKYFYLPLLTAVAAALKEGRLPLWEPGIFGGYPLFSDGESGMLYPPNLLGLWLFEAPAALVVLRIVRFYLAGAFTYALLRALGAARVGAAAGGLAFMCSGFVVAQVVHENLANGMVWLPLALYFVERAIRAATLGRYLLAAFAGVALAMQALAIHVQVCVFSALVVFPYLGWRSLVSGGAGVLRRLLRGGLIGAVMGLVAAGLSAVQMLPLLDLAGRSARGHGIDPDAATINSVTPFRLLTAVFPELMRRPDGAPFGHWVDWEVTVYAGVPVLFLAVVAIAVRRDRYALFFGALAAASLVLSMGRYGPPWVVTATQELLGDHGLRSPGRFAFLWSFSVAVLAGLGLDRLASWPAQPGSAAGARSGRGRRSIAALRESCGRLWFAAVAAMLAGVAAGLLLTAREGREWLMAHPEAAVAWLDQHYFVFDRSVPLIVTTSDVRQSLLSALDPANPTMAVWVWSVVAGYALVAGWYVFGDRPPRSRNGNLLRSARYGVLCAGSLAVVALPLMISAWRAHPTATVGAIQPRSPATHYLQDRLAPPVPGDCGEPAACLKPLYRAYATQSVYLYRSDVEPNALLPLGIEEAGGYSSLSSERYMAYAWAVETSQGRMLDAWNARFYLWPNRPDPLPSHELTSFHPQRPLLAGNAANAGARASFRLHGVVAENVRVIATLRDAWGAEPGAVAAWVFAVDESGAHYRWPLRVGIEIAEATAPVAAPGADGDAQPGGSGVAARRPLPVFAMSEAGGDGAPVEAKLFYASLPLPGQRTLVRLGLEAQTVPGAPEAILRVYGLGAGQPDWWVHNVVWHDRDRFQLVFHDDQVLVYENDHVLPRAYLVPLAVPLPQQAHVKQMAERAFDPERMLLIDAPPEQLAAPWEDVSVQSWFAPDTGAPGDAEAGQPPLVSALDSAGYSSRSPSGVVHVRRYEGERVTLQVDALTTSWLFLSDTFDPGWQAYVDGERVPVFLANGMFRTVAVPEGQHEVEFRYEPAPLQYGAAISLTTGLLLLIITTISALIGAARHLRRPAPQPRRSPTHPAPTQRNSQFAIRN